MASTLLCPDDEALQRFREWNERACYLRAWEAAQAYAPLKEWTGREGRLEASRLATGLHDQRLGSALTLRAVREFPGDAECFFMALFAYSSRYGALPGLRKLRAWRERYGAVNDPALEADFCATEGWLYAALNDFEPAHEAIARALTLAPEGYWGHTELSRVLEMEDRYDEALEAASRGYELAPYRPSVVLQLVDCLVHKGRDDEAIALLKRAHAEGESSHFAMRLVYFYSEREQPDDALHYLAEGERQAPLVDRRGKEWLRRRRADMLYLKGDMEGFLAEAEELPEGSFHRRAATSLRRPGAFSRERKRLEVPFIRQHRMTCAPATLAALAAYWGKQCDHEEISRAICYDGTPWQKERLWAEANGFHTAEFRLTRESLMALIDRGVPFTLTTQSILNGHLQACIGYDDRQDVVLLRDPTERHYGEVLREALIESHPVRGVRCLLLLPEEEKWRIEGVELPDAAWYDAYHDFCVAEEGHQRGAMVTAMERIPAEHPLGMWTAYQLAMYDRNAVVASQVLERLVERFPENAPLRHSRLMAVQLRGDFALERRLIAEELQREGCDPIFYAEMGELLQRDARHAVMADYYLRKAIRLRRTTGAVYASYAAFLRQQWRFHEAAEVQRVAACSEVASEYYSAGYAQLCRLAGEPEKGVTFLRSRVERQGSKAAGPWLTLLEELNTQHRAAEAMELLERAFLALPEDGQLLLQAGYLLATSGQQERGLELMRRAHGRVYEGQWTSEMAYVCSVLGLRDEEREHRRAYLKLEPRSLDGHRTMAILLSEEEGGEAAVAFLRQATEAQPDWAALWALRASWEAQEVGPEAAIVSLERSLAICPDADGELANLARHRFRAGQVEAAFADAREALAKNPHAPENYRTLAALLSESGQREEAAAMYREALKLDVDNTLSAEGLMELAATKSERHAALDFIEREMRRQVSNGDIVPCYRTLAYPLLEPEMLRKRLAGFCEERPDLWQTWQARLEQALDMELAEEARAIGRELTERFPLLPRIWVEMARVAEGPEEEIRALRRAVDISPGWSFAVTRLSEALQGADRYDEALAVLEENTRRNPGDGAAYGYPGELLWRLGRREEGFGLLLAGMKRCPGYQWGWGQLAEWAVELKREDDVEEVLLGHLSRRQHLSDWHLTVADVFIALGRRAKALEGIEEALQRFPQHSALYERHARLLAGERRYDEALAACTRGETSSPEGPHLKGRRAAVLYEMGRSEEAITELRATLQNWPDYSWGSRMLYRWLCNAERWKEAVAHCRNWVRYEPQFSTAHGCLGEALEQTGDPAAARTAYAKALSIDPGYLYAGQQLFGLQLEAEQYEEAGATHRLLERHLPAEDLRLYPIRLAFRLGQREEAVTATRQWLSDPEADPAALAALPGLYADDHRTEIWRKLVQEAMRSQPEPSVPLLELWVRSLAPKGQLRAARRLRQISDLEARAKGWIALLDQATPGAEWRTRYVIWRHRQWLCSRVDTWGAAGSALLEIGAPRAANRWFAAQRHPLDALAPGALFNASVARSAVKGWDAALPLRTLFLRVAPENHLATVQRTILALDHAMNGRIAQAVEDSRGVHAGQLSGYYLAMHQLLESILHAAEGREEKAREAYSDAVTTFNGWDADNLTAYALKRTQKRLAALLPWANGKSRKIRKAWGCYQKTNFGRAAAVSFAIYIAYRLLKEAVNISG